MGDRVVNGCQTVEGSIYIQNFTANEIINLSGLQRVHGDLIIDGNRGLTQIILVNLAQVDGELKLKDSFLLKRIDFPKLTSVRSLELSILPLLETVQFSQGLSEVVDAITITDTAIKAIEGLTVNKVGNVSIANNVNLTRIDLSHLEQINGVISISANSPHTILDLSSVSSLFQGDFRHVATLLGLNRVQKATGDLSFISNQFATLSLPNVTEITGTLTVSENKQLTNMSVPNLRALGGALAISNNTNLISITGPNLEIINGSIEITGCFEKIDLPKLSNVQA
ncbi:hypothetical protein G6F57_005600 [Rhizopus arrhizus]|uniref:Receptor L-domain domain-containing protein n=1 Tax=Rhizopus oryzae TaxID=64495 RepID=A0A9P6XBN9_RHIOR|nr:hypothetical protein G6F23_005620 [Rhizopus arrhizus]KAG1405973.1 hypothetical protein G6F58_009915 [Rhizopus delemar]KAG0789936.1 hypothetical protein G6F22_006559 [Rhizopus arrhizus]KAG0791296.1 hypothetical protein G6F21_005185 [Rhizopus arrhizus]KAG0811860.1 hypothetical protein G6F20_006821 [Rhizopus arrhizus]